MKMTLFIPSSFKLQIGRARPGFGEISVLVAGRDTMPLEGARNPLDNEICPQFTKNLHDHDQSNLVDKPLPLPRVGKLMGGPHVYKTVIFFPDHISCPILSVLQEKWNI